MKEPPGLFTVHGIVGGIEVQDQFRRFVLERVDESIHQHLMHPPRRRPPGAVLEPAQRGGAGQGPIAPHRRLQRHFAAQRVVIVQVLVSQRQGVHPVTKQRACVVATACAPAWVLERPGHRIGQTQVPVSLAQQQ